MGFSMIQPIDDMSFDRTAEQATTPILVEFWQPGCGHCHALLQELELVQAEVGDRLTIYTMNVQENFLIPGELEIQSLPTLALYVDSQFRTFIGGIGKKQELLQQLTQWLPSLQPLLHDLLLGTCELAKYVESLRLYHSLTNFYELAEFP